MADAAPTRQMTADEFLRWEDGSDTRYELVHGRPVAMAPAADRHGRIAGNVWGEIDRRLAERPPCCGIVEGGVWIDDDNFYVPDVVATCAPPSDDGMVKEPFLIVEVISPSNEKDELSTKVQAYIKLGHVNEIWLVDSRQRWVQQWRRAGTDSWIVGLPLAGGSQFTSPTLGDDIGLDRLYRNTEL